MAAAACSHDSQLSCLLAGPGVHVPSPTTCLDLRFTTLPSHMHGCFVQILQRVLTEAVKPVDGEGPEPPDSVPAAEPLTSLDIQRVYTCAL